MWRTELAIEPGENQFTHRDPVLTLGSCFSDVIGQKLAEHKFQVRANPFGTTYNPISILNLLHQSISNLPPRPDGFVQRDELYLHHDFHSSFVQTSEAALNQALTEKIEQIHTFLKSARVLVLTFGTTNVYEQLKTEKIVNNCHKVAASAFERHALSLDELQAAFDHSHTELSAFNPELKIICTVSPVRHVRDTLVQNSLSKSVLRVFCDELQFAYSNVEYFPAYELMVDDLRDYRFYKEDLIHPTAEAETYIWNKFGLRYFDEKTRIINEDWQEIVKGLNHRAFNPKSSKHQQFLKKLLAKVESFSSYFNVDQEMDTIKNQIN